MSPSKGISRRTMSTSKHARNALPLEALEAGLETTLAPGWHGAARVKAEIAAGDGDS